MTEWLLLLLDSFRGVWRFVCVAWGWNSCEWHPCVLVPCVAALLSTFSPLSFSHSVEPLSLSSFYLSFCLSLPTALYIITATTTRVCVKFALSSCLSCDRAGPKSCDEIIKESITLCCKIFWLTDKLGARIIIVSIVYCNKISGFFRPISVTLFQWNKSRAAFRILEAWEEYAENSNELYLNLCMHFLQMQISFEINLLTSCITKISTNNRCVNHY